MWSRTVARAFWRGAITLKFNATELRVISHQWQRVGFAQIHLGRTCAAKIFVDRENQYAHDVLEQSLKPYQIFRTQADSNEVPNPEAPLKLPALVLEPPAAELSDSLSIAEIFDAFRKLTHYCAQSNILISDQCFQPFTKLFCARSHQLSDEQLLTALRQLTQIPVESSSKAPNYVEMWNNLDIECCRRLEKWSSDQQLLVCDAWYTLHLARISEFVHEALRKLGRKVRRMRPEQLVQAMFLCNVLRRPMLEMFDFEVNLAKCANDMTLKELGVMSMGFFKTQTPIRSPELLEHVYKRLLAELDTVEDITLVAIMKVLRYSSKLPQVELMKELLEALCGQVERISLLSCLHAALFGVELQFCNDDLLELILKRFNRDLAQARLKDLERICLAIGVFNYHSPTGIENELSVKILQALESKVDEILKYPRCFPTCLHYLSLRGHYNTEMLSSVLDKRFIQHAYGRNLTMGREIFNLDSFVKINLRDAGYEGNQLPDKYRRTMGKMLTHYIPERNPKFKLNTTDRILVEMKETLDGIVRPNCFKHILPHFERPDIVICYDNRKRMAIPMASQCPEDYNGAILTRQELLGDLESPDIDTVAVVIAGWNNVVREKDRLTGLFAMKLKQLSLLGHKHVVIYWHEWRELETPIDRQKFLQRKLVNVLKF